HRCQSPGVPTRHPVGRSARFLRRRCFALTIHSENRFADRQSLFLKKEAFQMARSYRYISGDSHLEIDSKNWIPRMPAKHRDRAPKLIRLPDGGDAWLVEGKPLREVPNDLYGGKGREVWLPFGQSYENTPGTGSPEQRLREQDMDGIDAEVFFPGASSPSLWRSIKDDDAYR